MIEAVKPYPAMKDSGVPWLGAVPEHWELVPNRAMLRKRKILVGDRHSEYQLLSLTKAGVIVRDVSTGRGKFSADMGSSQEVRVGDLIFCLFDVPETPRTVGLSKYNGMITGAYTIFECRDDQQARFMEAFYIAMDDRKLLSPLYSGLRNTIPPSVFLGAKTPLPPPDEQAAIVRFLDYADRRIRRYIRAKQKLIALLEEQKQAIIHRAVTRGLDPNVRLKPSGVEWLGDVPEHWEVMKLRQCGSIAGGLTPSMADRSLWDGDVPWVTPKDMKRFTIAAASMNVSARALEATALRLIPAGSVLLVVRGMILARRVPIARTIQPVTINQDMKAVVPGHGIEFGFLAYRMDAAQATFVQMIDEAGHGTKRFPTERWKDVVFAIPPANEQRAIVRYLDAATERLADAEASTKREIDLLREYRTRLIADVVTGKLDVREAALLLPDEAEEAEAIDEVGDEGDADEMSSGGDSEAGEEAEV
jgi:type I restriction enzyme S subunit